MSVEENLGGDSSTKSLVKPMLTRMGRRSAKYIILKNEIVQPNRVTGNFQKPHSFDGPYT